MADPIQGTEPAVKSAPDEFETKFKARLKEQYGIEDDPDSFKTKRSSWTKAEEELPQYQATLQALIQHIKDQQEAGGAQTVASASADDDEEKLRTISKLDPYEGSKRMLSKFEERLDAKLQQLNQNAVQQSEQAITRREGLRRAYDVVKQQWPEAFDTNTDLHKLGKQIYQAEMSQSEQQHPQAFLIATERAAGRLGVAPKGKRSTNSSTRRDQASAQSVTRDKVRGDSDEEDQPLTARQKQVAEGMGVDPKVYKQALKNRRDQAKKQEDE